MMERLRESVVEKMSKIVDERDKELEEMDGWMWGLAKKMERELDNSKKRMWKFLSGERLKRVGSVIGENRGRVRGWRALEGVVDALGLLLDVSIGLCKGAVEEREGIVRMVGMNGGGGKDGVVVVGGLMDGRRMEDEGMKGERMIWDKRMMEGNKKGGKRMKKEALLMDLKSMVRMRMDEYEGMMEGMREQMVDDRRRMEHEVGGLKGMVEEYKRTLEGKDEEVRRLKMNLKRLSGIAVGLRKEEGRLKKG